MFKFYLLLLGFFIFIFSFVIPKNAYAIVDPTSVTNNKFGIHLISSTDQEASEAAQLVNSSGGDWGYVTLLIQRNEMDKSRWQEFFDDLRRRHLIPLVRIATNPKGNNWEIPAKNDAQKWADFLNSLNWPVKNRYVIIYNEPNQGHEWSGNVNPSEYANVLNDTIDALKKKNSDFFVLNAGFDASAPQQPPLYYDEEKFLEQMNQAVPGIFNKLDGWVSHSYPNPGFVGSPNATGRGTVRTWQWELNLLKNKFGVSKNLPVFITETGWEHASGVNYDPNFPSSDQVGQYYKEAFANAWNSNQIVAVTPFVLDYQYTPFDHFSFKKITGESQNPQILGIQYPEFYSDYQTIMDIPKQAGKPDQVQSADLVQGSIYASIVIDRNYTIPLVFKNTGESIWNYGGSLQLKVINADPSLGLPSIITTDNNKIEPGSIASFIVHFHPVKLGNYKISFQLYNDGKLVSTDPVEFTTDVESPVVLDISAALPSGFNPSGNYLLLADSDIIKSQESIALDQNGYSSPIQAKVLLPDKTYKFTLEKDGYSSKVLNLYIKAGINNISFGEMQPTLMFTLLHPQILLRDIGL